MSSRIASSLVLLLLLPVGMAAEDSDRVAKATGGKVGAPEVGAVAQALGVTADAAAYLIQEGGTTHLLPTETVKSIGDNAVAILGVCQFAVNVYQNKQVQWSDAAGLAATVGSWAELVPPPYGSLAQIAIVTGQSVQANNQAGRDLNYEVAVDYYHGAGGDFARQYDPAVTQGGAVADQFITSQLDPRTRTGDFSAAFAEYCQRRYHNDNIPLLIQQIGERRRNGQSPIPGELRGVARQFLDDQKGIYHLNNEIVRMRAFVTQNLTKIRALSELAQRLRDDPEFIERYKKFYREQTGSDDEDDKGGAEKFFRVHLVSGYDGRALGFRSVMLSSTERILNSNEDGLTGYERVSRQQQSIEVIATAPDHDGFSAAIPLSAGGRQTVELKLEPTAVEFVVHVTSGGQPVDDATVRMLGPSGRLQVQAAPGGNASFTLRPGAWTAQVTSPTHSEARQDVPVPLGRPGSATIALKRMVEATPTTRPTEVPKGKRREWVLDNVETHPEKPSTSTVFTPKMGTSIHLNIYNGDKEDLTWNAPPQVMTTAGWTASLHVATQTVARSREGPHLCAFPKSGFKEKEKAQYCADCLAEGTQTAGASCGGDRSVEFVPDANASSLRIDIGTWDVGYSYRYRQAP